MSSLRRTPVRQEMTLWSWLHPSMKARREGGAALVAFSNFFLLLGARGVSNMLYLLLMSYERCGVSHTYIYIYFYMYVYMGKLLRLPVASFLTRRSIPRSSAWHACSLLIGQWWPSFSVARFEFWSLQSFWQLAIFGSSPFPVASFEDGIPGQLIQSEGGHDGG